MKQIVMQDDDFKEILRSLELSKFTQAESSTRDKLVDIRQMHRAFHYEVTRWAQKHGADVTK